MESRRRRYRGVGGKYAGERSFFGTAGVNERSVPNIGEIQNEGLFDDNDNCIRRSDGNILDIQSNLIETEMI